MKPKADRSFFESRAVRRPWAAGILVAVWGLLAGLTCSFAPVLAWTLAAAMLLLAVVLLPAPLRIGAAVLAAALSRLLVSTGLFPELANFFHFALALATALLTRAEAERPSALGRELGIGLLGFLAANLISWLINGGQLLRPLLDWLVFAEPLLLVYALAVAPPDSRNAKALWILALGIPFIQLPLAVHQALSLGLGDAVEGLFIGMGAGAHVAGAVSVLGSLICTARAVSSVRAESGPAWLFGAASLLLVAVLADAKQVVIGFLPALFFLLFSLLRLRWSRVAVLLPVLAALILGAFSSYKPLQMVLDWRLVSRGIIGKVQAFYLVADRLSSMAGRWLFGLGPGHSVSRVALMSLEAYIKPNSPVALLGLRSEPTTRDIWMLSASNWLFSSSSVWTGVSSWLGLLGDLGLAGLGMYLWMCWRIWRRLRSSNGWKNRLAKAVMVMCGLLSFLYSWLEEPGFTLPAALIVGLGLASAPPAETAKGQRHECAAGA